jgi:hypothetical protein
MSKQMSNIKMVSFRKFDRLTYCLICKKQKEIAKFLDGIYLQKQELPKEIGTALDDIYSTIDRCMYIGNNICPCLELTVDDRNKLKCFDAHLPYHNECRSCIAERTMPYNAEHNWR